MTIVMIIINIILLYNLCMLKISLLALDYPCPLFSSRSRSAVYGEVGHTIMNLLAVSRCLIYLARNY